MGRPARRLKNGLKRSGGAGAVLARPSAGRGAVDVSSLLATALGHHKAGRLDEAMRLYQSVLDRDRVQPDALHLLGVIAYQCGRHEGALSLIERALARRPAAPDYYLNYGNVLLALGRRPEAIAAYRRTAELAPTDPEAHNNLGNALVQSGQVEEGIAELQEAIRLRPEHPTAYYSLGTVLRETKRFEGAIAAFKTAIRLNPHRPDGWTNLGVSLFSSGRYAEAQPFFEEVLRLQPDDPTALVNLAEALRAQGRLDASVPHYERALAAEPSHALALKGLARVRSAQGDHAEAASLLGRLVDATTDDPDTLSLQAEALIADERLEEAFRLLADALERHPGHRALITSLVEVLQTVPSAQGGESVRAALLAACSDDTFNPMKLMLPVLRVIWSDPAYLAFEEAVQGGKDPLAAGLPLPTRLIQEPVVLAALPRVVFCSPGLERVLTLLRRHALLRGTSGDSPSLAAQPLPRPFLCALARAAFVVEYSWLVEPEETARVSALRAKIEQALASGDGRPTDLEDLLILAALYGSLGALSGAERLAAAPELSWSPSFAPIVKEQVIELFEERAIAAELPTLTPIDDGISVAVRAMYEQNPYPRWRAARHSRVESLQLTFRALCPDDEVPAWPTPTPVLIAGAGTGQHPIEAAMRMPEADVLAVDLSRTSLAYAARMAKQLGVPNVRFAQADILALDLPEQSFALIECAGVLHHLEDPLKGWRVLRRLLRPDGIMRIGLYSERARAGVVAARTMIARTHVPASPEGIQLARRLILSLPDQHPAVEIGRFADFYSMSGFRDLVMHVQEHRFTIARLAESLEALDLQFLGFDLEEAVLRRFRSRFPGAGSERDLACWDQFEAEVPETFAAMYQFWCRPRP